MNTLTCAELLRYPGTTLTERLRAHHEEGEAPEAPIGPALAPASPPSPLRRGGRLHGALPMGSVIDLSRFTGRDRVERAANYLRAHVPRTAAWADEELRTVAARMLSGAESVIE